MLDDAKMLDDEYKADQERSWGTHFVSGGVEFATSLFWQSLQNQDAPLAEIIESSQGVLEGADLYCIKKGKTPQFGICVSARLQTGTKCRCGHLVFGAQRPTFLRCGI